MLLRLAFAILLSVSTLLCWAHGDLHERIEALTEQIKSATNKAQLIAKRGQLQYQHEAYNDALTDFCTAYQMGLNEPMLDLWQAETYLAMHYPGAGLVHITDYLKTSPKDVQALRIYAKLAFQNNNLPLAETQFVNVINNARERLPFNYLELVQVLKAQNKYTEAIQWLKTGTADIGNLVSFEQELIKIYELTNDYSAAIELLKAQLTRSTRKEGVYYEIANFYLANHDEHQYQLYLDSAKLAWDKLPKHIKQTPAMQKLQTKIAKANENL